MELGWVMGRVRKDFSRGRVKHCAAVGWID